MKYAQNSISAIVLSATLVDIMQYIITYPNLYYLDPLSQASPTNYVHMVNMQTFWHIRIYTDMAGQSTTKQFVWMLEVYKKE